MRPFIAKPPQQLIDRRDFLKWIGGAGITLLAAACQPLAPTQTPPAPTATPFQPSAVSIDPPTPTPLPTATATIPAPTATPDPRTPVAIGRLPGYDQAQIRAQLETMLADLGGPGARVKPG